MPKKKKKKKVKKVKVKKPKLKIDKKNDTMNVNDNPPQAPVSTHSRDSSFPNSINSS